MCVCACTRAQARLVTQSCPTQCHPMNYSLLGSSVNRILQARILEWVAMPSSRGSALLDPEIEPTSPALQADSLPLSPKGSPKKQMKALIQPL